MNAIEIRDVSKHYKDFCLDRLNLTLPSGCIMGLIGENGAGKSTTIRLILDMIHKEGGSIRILGKDNHDNLKLTKEEIGVVPDEVGFPGVLTIRQVNTIMKNTYRNWDENAFRQYQQKFSLPEKKPFQEFSRGMKMKLGIAVALSHHPRLLILDEPTNGLDPVARDEVVEIFGEFTRQEDHAVLLSSHIISDLEKICDYVAFLHQGKLLLCEEKDVLLEEYRVVHCTGQQLAALPKEAVVGSRVSAYGAEAVVKRSWIPAGMQTEPVSLEELFVFMVRFGETVPEAC